MRVTDDLRYAPSYKCYEHRWTALNLGNLPDNSQDEVDPPSPLQESKKWRGRHQSGGSVDRFKDRTCLQETDEVAGDHVRGVDREGRDEAGQEAEEGDEPEFRR